MTEEMKDAVIDKHIDDPKISPTMVAAYFFLMTSSAANTTRNTMSSQI